MTLLIRADASVAIGTGHAMRCIALSQAWSDSGDRVVFAMRENTPALRERLAAESAECVPISAAMGSEADADQTVALARERHADSVVVDGYHFGDRYQESLRSAGLRTLFIDDYGHAPKYSADLVLNQNAGASATMYLQKLESTRLLLGPRYALLRREFGKWRNWQRNIPEICRAILILMGGSDPANLTARAIEAVRLANVQNVETTVVVGGSNPNLENLRKIEKETNSVMLRRDVTDIDELMAKSDVAISAAGSTCWELCLMGVPSLLIDIAENQTAVARSLEELGCAVHVGDASVTSESLSHALTSLMRSQKMRESFSQRSRSLVDGLGARRVVSALRSETSLWLRPATANDRQLLWQWANDPEVRTSSFSTDPIPWETHVAWFERKMKECGAPERTSHIFIAEDEEANPVGQIRFDRRNDRDRDWDVDVSVSAENRGKKISTPMITLGVRELERQHGSVRVHAFVKAKNVRSAKAFERAAFRDTGDNENPYDRLHLVHDK